MCEKKVEKVTCMKFSKLLLYIVEIDYQLEISVNREAVNVCFLIFLFDFGLLVLVKLGIFPGLN